MRLPPKTIAVMFISITKIHVEEKGDTNPGLERNTVSK